MKKILSICLVYALLLLPMSGFAESYRKGDSGETVKTIQQKLKQWGYYNGEIDGIYGSKTVSAVKYFQRKNGLTADGIAGSATLGALGISVSGSNQNSQAYLLARVINGEARGEPYTGQVAVGAVILNRVRSSSFPNTISGVVYQKGAFDCMTDGQVNAPVSASCIRAAQDALAGWDPSGGAIYYYNPKTATNQWIRTRQIIASIGKHVFCK